MNAMIRLRTCAGWSGPPLSACAQRHVFAWRGPNSAGLAHISSKVLKNKTDQLTLVLLSPDTPCLWKQCRSRSVCFWRRQPIWICTVCEYVNFYQHLGQVIWKLEVSGHLNVFSMTRVKGEQVCRFAPPQPFLKEVYSKRQLYAPHCRQILDFS